MLRAVVVLTLVALTACSSDTDGAGKPAETKVSCTFVPVAGQADLGGCLTATNGDPEALKKSCVSPNKYADAACSVTKGTRGCSYVDAKGVASTFWYQGTDWTNDDDAVTGMETDCAKSDGELISK